MTSGAQAALSAALPDAAPAHSETQLSADLQEWLHDNGVKGTQKAYETYLKQFRAFCDERKLAVFPASPVVVGSFLKFLAEERGLSASAVNIAAAAISSQYTLADIVSPTQSPLVKAVKKTVKRSKPASKPKKPLTVETMRRIVEDSRKGSWIDERDNCLLILLFVGALRQSEEVSLTAEDAWVEVMTVREAPEDVLSIFVEKSKTDQERHGHTRLIGSASDKLLCPIRLFRRWLEIRDSKCEWLFHARSSNARLSKDLPNGRLKARLKRIGIDPKEYGSHSGRRGAMTEAAKKGVDERLMKRHGNWRSDAVRLYIEESVEARLAVSNALLRDEAKTPAG